MNPASASGATASIPTIVRQTPVTPDLRSTARPSRQLPVQSRPQAGGPETSGAACAPIIRHIRTFAASYDQVGQARRFLAGLVGDDDSGRDAVTCVSELATNACLHSASARPGGTFTVRVLISHVGGMRVEVSDLGGPWNPAVHDDARPHGLAIVAALARDAGITGSPADGWTAWATFPGPSPHPVTTPEPARRHPPGTPGEAPASGGAGTDD